MLRAWLLIAEDDEVLIECARRARARNLRILEAYTPFPVEELEEILEIPESWLPRGGFWIGFLFGVTGLSLMIWMMAKSYPLIFGGKPYTPWPSFVPPTFEITVLTSAYGMGVIMFVVSQLIPMLRRHPVHPEVTSHKFVLVVDASASEEAIREVVKDLAVEVRRGQVPESAIFLEKSEGHAHA